MSLAHKQPFIPTGEFFVRKPFTWDNVDYKTDEEFPHASLGCEGRKLRNLYQAGYIKHADIEESDREVIDEDAPLNEVEKSSRADARKRRSENRKLAKAKKKK